MPTPSVENRAQMSFSLVPGTSCFDDAYVRQLVCSAQVMNMIAEPVICEIVVPSHWESCVLHSLIMRPLLSSHPPGLDLKPMVIVTENF
ncbi:unnamed protein product [Somion occarium]|uniref:Uncharacterized protein n=1 Tax=Somion occarium TaxID=3059160 RepID=A0ABP1E3X1_9APHY